MLGWLWKLISTEDLKIAYVGSYRTQIDESIFRNTGNGFDIDTETSWLSDENYTYFYDHEGKCIALVKH